MISGFLPLRRRDRRDFPKSQIRIPNFKISSSSSRLARPSLPRPIRHFRFPISQPTSTKCYFFRTQRPFPFTVHIQFLPFLKSYQRLTLSSTRKPRTVRTPRRYGRLAGTDASPRRPIPASRFSFTSTFTSTLTNLCRAPLRRGRTSAPSAPLR